MLRDIVLGIVQGLTEFLPISSSGHLVVAGELLDREPSLTFDLLLHVGTSIAVIGAMRSDLMALAAGALGRGIDTGRSRRLVAILAIATIPAALAGVLLEDQFEDLFERPGWVCVFWVVTGLWMVGAESVARRRGADDTEVDARRAIPVGLAQAAAITPGISRSGATIATGLALGIRRSEATRFSFLLSVPVILGAAVARIPDARAEDFDVTAGVIAGVIAATVSGWIAIRWLLRYVRTHSLVPFAIYLFVAAPVAAVLLAVSA